MKFDRRTLLIVGLVILLILLVCGWWNKRVQLADFRNQVAKFDVKEQKFLTEIGKKGEKLITQEQLILSQKDAIDLNLLQIGRLKKIKSKVIYSTRIVVDSVFVPFTDTLLLRDTIYPVGTLQVPKRFSLMDQHYSFGGIINLDGVLMDSIQFHNELKITLGNKSNGLFRASTPIVEIENSNPYVVTSSLQNIVIKNKKKWWEKQTTWFGIGFGVGATTLILISK